MKKGIYTLTLCILIILLSSYQPSKPLQYRLQTQLSASAENTFHFSMSQQILFSCKIDHISPIDRSPQKMTLTLHRIQGQAHYQDQQLFFDTDAKNIYSLEFEGLKKLLNKPIEVTLTRDRSIETPIVTFERLLQSASLENSYVNQDLIEQIVYAVLAPSVEHPPTAEKLYFPFHTSVQVAPIFSQSKTAQSLSLSQPLKLEGLYAQSTSSDSIHLLGNLKKEVQWQSDQLYVERYELTHQCEENEKKTLFKNPLSFDYTLSLQQVDPLS